MTDSKELTRQKQRAADMLDGWIAEAQEDLQAMAGQASPEQIVDAIIDGKIRHVTFR